jgi:hypothetical protein
MISPTKVEKLPTITNGVLLFLVTLMITPYDKSHYLALA